MPRKTKSKTKSRTRSTRRATRTKPRGITAGVAYRRTEANISGTANSLRIRHREMFYDMSGTQTGMKLISSGITATSTTMFPWLSNMTKQYQFYRFNSLRFEYIPACPTTTMGTVFAAIDYNWHDASPADYPTLSQTMGFVDGPTYSRLTCMLDRKQQLIRDKYLTGSVPEGADASWYRAGSLLFGTTTNGTESKLGRWYVHYDVTLLTPQPAITQVMPESLSTIFEFNATGASASNLFGTGAHAPLSGANSTIQNGQLRFNMPGDYVVTLGSTGTGGMDANPPTATVANGGAATLGDVIVSTGVKTVFQFLLTGILAGTTAYFSKLGVVSPTHTDVLVAPVDINALLASRQKIEDEKKHIADVADRVATLLMAEDYKAMTA